MAFAGAGAVGPFWVSARAGSRCPSIVQPSAFSCTRDEHGDERRYSNGLKRRGYSRGIASRGAINTRRDHYLFILCFFPLFHSALGSPSHSSSIGFLGSDRKRREGDGRDIYIHPSISGLVSLRSCIPLIPFVIQICRRITHASKKEKPSVPQTHA